MNPCLEFEEELSQKKSLVILSGCPNRLIFFVWGGNKTKNTFH